MNQDCVPLAVPRTLVRVEHASKIYPQVSTTAERLRLVRHLLGLAPAPEGFAALSEVSFEVRAGESLALIGENGAGKSTLLKLIAGVMQPTTGVVQVNARVGALLELGAGFNPEYSGRENIALACALHGLTREETAEREAGIIAFADIGEHIEQPVKHYSSGMVVRLGFAVATALKPDVMITDEVLAVGDEAFQRKCTRWVENYLAEGGTLLLCSHIMYHVQKLCARAIWLERGRVRMAGSSAEVVQAYMAHHDRLAGILEPATEASVPRQDDTKSSYHFIEFAAGEPAALSRAHGDSLRVSGRVHSPDGRMPHVAVAFIKPDGTGIFGTSTEVDSRTLEKDDQGNWRFAIEFNPLTLLPGEYLLRGYVLDPEALRLTDTVERSLQVRGDLRHQGVVQVPYTWR